MNKSFVSSIRFFGNKGSARSSSEKSEDSSCEVSISFILFMLKSLWLRVSLVFFKGEFLYRTCNKFAAVCFNLRSPLTAT